MNPHFLDIPDGRRIAYHRADGRGPGIVFLGGFRSDMGGTKALALEDWARAEGRAFLRFDYTGHGASSGDFLDGTIGAWERDAVDAVTALTGGPQVLVGSSMGGWIAVLLAQHLPHRVAGLVTVAAAPDFTEDAMYAAFDAGQRRALETAGYVDVASDYADDPYRITRRLIEDGRRHLVLRDRMRLSVPTRLLHGTADTDVALSVPLRILEQADGADIRLTLVKGADHRFSGPAELDLLRRTVGEVAALAAAQSSRQASPTQGAGRM
jgi:pimeloyl-ACP methyl ester carboxylesterase